MAKKTKLEERIGSDEFQRLSAKGMQDPTKQNQYSAKEVISEFRNRGGAKVDEGEGNIKQRFLDAQASGAKFNQKAQNYLTEQHGFDFGKKVENPVKEEKPVTPVTPETQEKAQEFKDQKMQEVQVGMNENLDSSRTFGNNQNTIGDDNEFYCNVNQGNQDFSVNVTGGRDGSMSNMGFGAASKAMMENSYNRDRATFSAGGEAAKAADRANKQMGTNNRIKALDTATDMNIDYFRKASDRATLGLYGDVWNMKAPTWKAPGELDPIEVTYNKDTEEEQK